MEQQKPKIFTTVISPEVHQLPGIGAISYTFDRKQTAMFISIANKDFARYDGAVAENIFKKVAGFREETDPFVIEAAKRAHEAWNITMLQLSIRTRKHEIVVLRQIIMWWLKANTKKSLSAIGAVFGNYDHNTVDHACKTIDNLLTTDMDVKSKVEDFLNAI